MYEHVKAYLNDPAQFAELINQVYQRLEKECPEEISDPKEIEQRRQYHAYEPVNPSWIDAENTAYMTNVLHNILPKGFPFFACVTVVKDPEWKLVAETEEEMGKHLRYILVTVVGNEYPAYQANYGIFNMCTAAQLALWEMARSTNAACTIGARVRFVEHEMVPLLQKAHVEYVTLYLGEKKYVGSLSFSEHTDESDINVYPVQMVAIRDMPCTPAASGFLAAYEMDKEITGMTEEIKKNNDGKNC